MRVASLALGALVLAAAGCGGAAKTETNVVTVTNVSTVTVPAAAAAAPHDYARFQMPSHNVGCGLDSGVLRCDILSGLAPEPVEACELDWTGVVLEARGAAQPECAGDTVFDASAPVLQYGETWSREGMSCLSRESGLECRNNGGHGFKLARASWSVN